MEVSGVVDYRITRFDSRSAQNMGLCRWWVSYSGMPPRSGIILPVDCNLGLVGSLYSRAAENGDTDNKLSRYDDQLREEKKKLRDKRVCRSYGNYRYRA